ncbi:MAG TPA: STAS domain-containing protein [Spirochaetales bacterium]|nr:STAS domain-containing protein [Spirochaetales bacterium]
MEWTPVATESGDGAEIRLVGDFDLYHAPLFSLFVLGKIEGGWRTVLLDLSGVGYLDSTGVGSIIRIAQALRKKGTKLRFRGLSGTPRRVLEMANILALVEETK